VHKGSSASHNGTIWPNDVKSLYESLFALPEWCYKFWARDIKPANLSLRIRFFVLRYLATADRARAVIQDGCGPFCRLHCLSGLSVLVFKRIFVHMKYSFRRNTFVVQDRAFVGEGRSLQQFVRAIPLLDM
jgi:hypothetical protein